MNTLYSCTIIYRYHLCSIGEKLIEISHKFDYMIIYISCSHFKILKKIVKKIWTTIKQKILLATVFWKFVYKINIFNFVKNLNNETLRLKILNKTIFVTICQTVQLYYFNSPVVFRSVYMIGLPKVR